MAKQNILKLLESGNFTIIYWDNGQCDLYRGKKRGVSEIGMDENAKPVAEFSDGNSDGYLPEIVSVLVEALGGKSDSI